MALHTESTCLQYADDTSLYRHCKVTDLQDCVARVEADLKSVSSWSQNNNLIFNQTKTKTILFSSSQMKSWHNLSRPDLYSVGVRNKPLERTNIVKVLGVTLNENLTWHDHFESVIKSSYATLRSLRAIKRTAPDHLKKSLVEMLVLSKLDYGNALFYNAPNYLVRRLQTVQNAAVGYVTGKFAKTKDVIGLKWLPVRERIDHYIAKWLLNRFIMKNGLTISKQTLPSRTDR